MITCENISELLVLKVADELDEALWPEVKAHLSQCPACSSEFSRLRSLMSDMADMDCETGDFIGSLDLQQTAASVARNAVNARRASVRFQRRWSFPVAAAVFFMGLLLGYVLFHQPSSIQNRGSDSPLVAQSISLIEGEMDRRGIVGYLNRTKLLMTDLFYSPKQSVDLIYFQNAFKKLLRENRYLSRNLSRAQLMVARGVLDKTGWLLTEMVMLGESANENELQRLREFFEKERLMIKIRLVEKELSSSFKEV